MKDLFKSKYLSFIFKKKVWVAENIKMIRIMKKYYSQNKIKRVTYTFFRKVINDTKFEIFQNHINELNDKLLYCSQVHGYKHVLNVSLFSYLIACNEKLDISDLDIILEIALYHDIGRDNDKEDSEHGQRGAQKMIEQMSKYSDCMIIPAVIHAHSLSDDEAKRVFLQYNLEESQYKRYIKFLTIIKDADALDRFRLRSDSLKTKYLRIEYSKELISLACALSKVTWND